PAGLDRPALLERAGQLGGADAVLEGVAAEQGPVGGGQRRHTGGQHQARQGESQGFHGEPPRQGYSTHHFRSSSSQVTRQPVSRWKKTTPTRLSRPDAPRRAISLTTGPAERF